MGDQNQEEFVLPVKRTWIDVQKKTFTGWANTFLSERLMKIEDLEVDLDTGVLLCNLLEEISGKKIPHSKNPRMRIQKVENNGFALKFIDSEGIKLVGIGAEDIVDHKLKLILGLIWTLILRYQIQMGSGDDSPKKALLEWVNRQIAPYGLQVANFTEDWKDGRAISALSDSLSPGVLLNNRNLAGLSGNPVRDIDRSMDVAQEQYDIPKILDAADMAEVGDELSNITYISYFRDWLENHAEKERQRLLRSAYPGYCYAYGPGLEGAIANEPAQFTIQAVNVYEDELKHGGETGFKAEIVRDDGETVVATIKDTNDGKYPVTYTAALPGDYTVTVTLNGEKIKDMPVKVKIIGADAGASNAFGPGLQGANVGKPAPFKIQARDAHGNPLKSGGDAFKVRVTGPENLGDIPVKDNGNGTYDVVYHPNKLGEYTVEVSLRGQPISNSPFKVLCKQAVAENSWADGPGVEPEGVRAHHPALFTVHAVDVDGKPVKTGGDPFKARISGPENKDIVLRDNGDGTYTGEYEVGKPGNYEVDVSLHGEPIKAMPARVHVKASADPSKSYAEGQGLDDPKTHFPNKFTIHAVDHDGKPRTDGGDDFKVDIRGPENIKPKLRDNGDGTYDVEYEAKKPGDYEVNVTCDGVPIRDMPRRIKVKPTSDAGKSWADGPGLQSGKVFDNEPTYFTIHAVDHDGKPRTDGGEKFDVKINGPENINPPVVDNGDGTYTVKYAPDRAGDYVINVTQDGQPIKDAPFRVQVREGTDAHNSTVRFATTIQARDKHGEPKTFGGDDFKCYLKKLKDNSVEQLEGTDNGDGTYTCSYELVDPGEYKLHLKLNGKSVRGSPFRAVKKDK